MENIELCSKRDKTGYCFEAGCTMDTEKPEDVLICKLCGYFELMKGAMRYFKVVKNGRFHGMFSNDDAKTIEAIKGMYKYGKCEVYELGYEQYQKVMEEFK